MYINATGHKNFFNRVTAISGNVELEQTLLKSTIININNIYIVLLVYTVYLYVYNYFV